MKKEESNDTEGGVKKIIYNGSTKKRTLFDDEDNYSQQWNYRTQPGNVKQPGQQFNLDDVWSIKKNVGVNKSPIANPAGGSFWERGAGKGYYSRHGGLADFTHKADREPKEHSRYSRYMYSRRNEENTPAGTTSQVTGGSGGYQQQGKSYSYSYGGNNADRLQPMNGTGSTGTSPRGMGSSLRPGTMNNGHITNGGMMSNGGGPTMTNGHSPNMGPTPTNMGHQGRHGGPVSSRYQGPVANHQRKF